MDYSQAMDEINQCWNVFQTQAGDFVKMIADSKTSSEGLSDMFALKALDVNGKSQEYQKDEAYYNALITAQKSAVDNQRNVSQIETAVRQASLR